MDPLRNQTYCYVFCSTLLYNVVFFILRIHVRTSVQKESMCSTVTFYFQQLFTPTCGDTHTRQADIEAMKGHMKVWEKSSFLCLYRAPPRSRGKRPVSESSLFGALWSCAGQAAVGLKTAAGFVKPPELIVLVDFKAIYPGVSPGIFASFPGVAHFLSFEEICQYPRVPQGEVANPWGTLGYLSLRSTPGKSKYVGYI